MDHINPKNVIHLVISVGLGVIFFVGMTTPIAIIPPVGDFINPSAGIWNTGVNAEHPVHEEISIPDHLSSDVTVYRDIYGVPHIYAENEDDLFFAQGYVQAQDRLWQIEFQRRLSSGKLSEILGNGSLNIDIFFREIGLYRSAESSLDLLNDHPQTKKSLESYAKGLNYYIDNLRDENLPFEFKFFNFKPSKWKIADTLAWTKLMSYSLAYGTRDVGQSTLCSSFGENEYDEIFPLVNPYQTPIIAEKYGEYFMPDDYNWRASNLNHSDINAVNFTLTSTLDECNTVPDFLKISNSLLAEIDSKISSIELPFGNLGTDFVGSNNWVVHGNFTETGKPIVGNDPHLGHNLPSVWYQISLHITSLSNFDVWGYSLLGAPGILLGHNENIAWGFTNVGADMIDWYHFESNTDKSEYFYNGSWLSYIIFNEPISIKENSDYNLTVKETIYGPIISLEHPLVMQWADYGSSTAIIAINKLNRASNYEQFKEALRYFDAAGQNIVYGDVEGNIALQITGQYPVRVEGHGRFVVNASADPDMNRWSGFIPYEDMPFSFNPSQGYIQSANQRSAGPTYEYYLSNDQGPTYRDRRIDFLLHEATTTGDNKVNIEDFKAFQGDNFDTAAEAFVPYLISAAKSTDASNFKSGVSVWDNAVNQLENWDFIMEREESAPLIYSFFLEEFRKQTFEDEYGQKGIEDVSLPSYTILEFFTRENDQKWFDDVSTIDSTESRDKIILSSFKDSLLKLIDEFEDDITDWKWGTFHRLLIEHLPPDMGGKLSDDPRSWDGSKATLNAAGNNGEGFVSSGPSHRAIYDLSDLKNSLTTLPAGQSGNVLSKHYKDLLDLWYTYEYFSQYWYLEESDWDTLDDIKESTLVLKGGK
ncbi:MAG: penicillin acylase family protein [Candidatus Hodarchaeales archaeon]|jgi:penicillin amidase